MGLISGGAMQIAQRSGAVLAGFKIDDVRRSAAGTRMDTPTAQTQLFAAVAAMQDRFLAKLPIRLR